MAITTNNQNEPILKLSIQVRLNGLSFCMLDSQKKEVVWYKKTNFPRDYNPVKILGEIELIYEKEEVLQQKIEELHVLFSNDLYSFVPEEFFAESEVSNYLKFNTRILKTDVVANDMLETAGIANVYIPYTNITNYFFDKYGEFEYKHSISVFAQAVLNAYTQDETRAYLYNYNGYYDLVVVKNKQLLLCNTFSYETKEDFIYYLLFAAEQLELDPSVIPLYLLGEINEDSPLYAIAYKYIRNLNFVEPGFSIGPKNVVNTEFQREAFLLLKALRCE
ncbi:MAG: DUF3822 family protein [Gillisia sp.]